MTQILRNFCFTSYEKLAPKMNEKFCYMVYQQEKCPKTGKLHWQGYAEVETKIRFNTAKKLLGETVHIEARKGTQKEAIDYCKKKESAITDTQFESGTPKKMGERTDLKQLVTEVVEKKKTINDIVLENPQAYHLYGRTLEKAASISTKTRKEPTMIHWFWGETGTGKTRWVYDNEPSLYVHNVKSTWWEYAGEDAILFDDYRGEMAYNDLLKLADRYPYKVPRKYIGDINITATKLYITSPLKPEEIYKKQVDKKDSLNQLTRRIAEIKEFV